VVKFYHILRDRCKNLKNTVRADDEHSGYAHFVFAVFSAQKTNVRTLLNQREKAVRLMVTLAKQKRPLRAEIAKRASVFTALRVHLVPLSFV